MLRSRVCDERGKKHQTKTPKMHHAHTLPLIFQPVQNLSFFFFFFSPKNWPVSKYTSADSELVGCFFPHYHLLGQFFQNTAVQKKYINSKWIAMRVHDFIAAAIKTVCREKSF